MAINLRQKLDVIIGFAQDLRDDLCEPAPQGAPVPEWVDDQVTSLQEKNTTLEDANRNLRFDAKAKDDQVTALRDLLRDQSNEIYKLRSMVDAGDFQERVATWGKQAWSDYSLTSSEERALRFGEEAIELIQSCGLPLSRVETLAKYVYDRPKDPVDVEIGGVMVTLALLGNAANLSMSSCGEVTLASCFKRTRDIQRKNSAKPMSVRSEEVLTRERDAANRPK